jgi:hypothetical protein
MQEKNKKKGNKRPQQILLGKEHRSDRTQQNIKTKKYIILFNNHILISPKNRGYTPHISLCP